VRELVLVLELVQGPKKEPEQEQEQHSIRTLSKSKRRK
jgi:hypothetical protein